jgi:hypothetical protein
MANEKDHVIKLPPSDAARGFVQHRERMATQYPRGHPLIRGCGNEPIHLKYWHLEHETIFPRCQSVSRAGNGVCSSYARLPRLQEKIMITRFRSGDAAWAAAKRLSDLAPGHDYDAWPDRGCWVLIMRYRDDDGHLRFKLVGPEDRLSKKHHMQEKTRPQSKILPCHASANHPAAIRKYDP